MWHILTHTTTKDNILKILKSGYIGSKDKRHKKIENMVYMFYLSSILHNKDIKYWNFSHTENSIIIGFNPHILNNKKFVICDRRGGAHCLKKNYKIVESHYNSSKQIDFNKINSFINERIGNSVTNNLDFYLENIRNYMIRMYIFRLSTLDEDEYYSYVDKKMHETKKVAYLKQKYTDKINEIKNLPNNKILDYLKKLDYDFYERFKNNKYISSHEVVIDGTVDIKDINFIMISKTSTDEFKNELKKLCPDYIKIIEIEPNDITKYTKRIQKILEKNSENIEL